jgi:hypothetical protein
MRVQIPAYTDRWMMGDKFGTVVSIKKSHVGRLNIRTALLTANRHTPDVDIARVKLDKSGKIVRVVLDDCVEV